MVARVLMLVLCVVLGGCSATVVCPPVEGERRAVFVIDHGNHASLVVENNHGFLHRYSYGDRRWYAEEDTGIGAGFKAMFIKTPAVLSRRELHAEPDLDSVRSVLRVAVEHAYGFEVPAARADALILDLDGVFYADPAAHLYNERHGLAFSPHPRPYTIWHNSNHMVTEWMEDLGCRVTGSPMNSNWKRATP